ncbi:MAG: alanine racemase [Oleiphilaceae bacterium]|nr:alanine racemase [Oleiphilaceae bacterium]
MSGSSRLGRPLQAVIRRSAFLANIREVERRCPESNTLVVLKADAYGHGMVALAQMVGERDIAVATADEAQVLVDAGVENRIWVLEGPLNMHCLSLATRHRVVWVIHDVTQLDLLRAYAHVPLEVVLKLDTGMHRLGLDQAGLAMAVSALAELDAVDVIAVMSHFASSDAPASPSVAHQQAHFEALIASAGLDTTERSLSNSGAILYYPEAHQQWVRPGIMLYGAMPDPSQNRDEVPLQAVMLLQSAVIALHNIGPGESVGYGATWTAARPSLVATVAAGYADGYPRHAPSGTPVAVNGVRCPLVGRVSMDMLAVDVTDLAEVAVGDPVELWGEQVTVDEVAQAAGTIAYELLTGVSARVPREYR